MKDLRRTPAAPALALALTLALALVTAPISRGGEAPAGASGPPRLAGELTLGRCVELALGRNPALAAVEERKGEVEAAIREAKGEAYPQLSLVTSWSRSRNPSLLNSRDLGSFLDLFPGGSFEPQEQELYNLGLELRQPVFTWGKTRAAIDLAGVAAEATGAQIETARLDTALAAAEAFYGALAARRSLATVEVQRRVREEALAVVAARYEIGEATRLERLQAEASLAEIEPLLAGARGAVEVSEQLLRAVLDLPVDTPLALAEPEGLPSLPAAGRAELRQRAAGSRPELTDLDLRRQALDLQARITTADGRPQVDLVGSYGHTSRLPENLGDSLYQDWAASLALRWEFFDGGKRESQIAQLASQERQLELGRRDLVHRIELELEQAATGFATARRRLEAAETAAAAAREASRVAAEAYQEGAALQADLLDSQQRQILAELAVIAATYDAWVEAARLDRALGSLPGGGVPTGPPPAATPALSPEQDLTP